MKIETMALTEHAKQVAGAKTKETGEPRAQEQQAFSIDKSVRISGVFGRPVYEKPSQDADKIMEEISNEAKTKDATDMKNEMLFVSNRTTGKDLEQLQEDGYALPDTKVETVVTETDKIKMQLAKAGKDIRIFGDDLSREQIEELAGSEALAAQLASEFAAADLPLTEENRKEAAEASDMANELNTLSEGALKYMLDNQLEPTIENLHRAEYSGSISYQKPQEQADYEPLAGQIAKVIEKAGLPVGEETLADSQWLIANEIPLTPENLTFVRDLKMLELPEDEGEVARAIAEAVADGKRPKDGVLMEGYSLREQAQEAMDVVESATEDDLAWLVDHDMELTIENLRIAGKRGEGSAAQLPAEKEMALLTAQRQLEEARLAMSAQANYALLKQGISIDTKPLVELVDALKAQENAYYKQLLSQDGIPATPENTAVYRQTTETVEALKEIPAYTLGIPEISEADLEKLYETGKALEDTFRKAGESYEMLMTAPRADLGDSIRKAFANVDDILKDLGLATSGENERAVRILAYNRREITEESVLQMKAQDEEVQRCFKNMTPSVVREMIRAGINPLDMRIAELNRKAEEIKTDQGIEEEERFSQYLYRMDKAGAMTGEERSAFLGIYRLIAQVEKTDGAVIGALLEQGGAFTMRNLLTQIRSEKHGRMEYKVDDAFGGVSAKAMNLSITEQIEMGYQTDCLKDVMDELTPAKLARVMEDDDWQELTPEQLAAKLREVQGEAEVAFKDEAAGKEYVRELTEDLNTCAGAPEEVYQLLLDCSLPATVHNILAAYEMTADRNAAFRRFFSDKSKGRDISGELAAAKQQILEEFGEAVKSPEELAKAQKTLAETAENVMKTMIAEDDDVTSLDLRQMKMLHTQIAIGTAQLREEKYAIPVLIGDEITNISLKIVRGREKKGMVDILFSTNSLGQVAARLSADRDGVSGCVTSERQETTELFTAQAKELARALGDYGAVRIDYLTSGRANFSNSAPKRETEEHRDTEEQAYGVQTGRLYRMAETFIRAVKGLE